jgi:hypothetical protein
MIHQDIRITADVDTELDVGEGLADLDEEELAELAEDLEYALTDGPLYPDEVELYAEDHAEVMHYLERLRSAESRTIRGAPDLYPGERTLNMVSMDEDEALTEEVGPAPFDYTRQAFIEGRIVAHRWARIGPKHYPRFNGGGE